MQFKPIVSGYFYIFGDIWWPSHKTLIDCQCPVTNSRNNRPIITSISFSLASIAAFLLFSQAPTSESFFWALSTYYNSFSNEHSTWIHRTVEKIHYFQSTFWNSWNQFLHMLPRLFVFDMHLSISTKQSKSELKKCKYSSTKSE